MSEITTPNKKPKFYTMKQDDNPEGKRFGKFADPNALHVMLWSPNYPRHNILYDGEKYWIFLGGGTDGYKDRKEYQGSTDYLRIVPAHAAILYSYQWDFKVRDIPVDVTEQYLWGEYLKRVA